ncbi:A24 family peptidase (plasmid) [Streptomyces sp. FXJ1.172]|uniref:prepilin peptidase n=1 Tax=Streptomyces sp. FXJ1.172 TaxID=710705 RepID=UPI0023DCF1BA|nr:A24 family peptidase [Streptomyces sp. FXJ1.172]WEP00939.1 A24 family peptidase [Streptomyces sp. FXJ1.172]
MAVLWGVGAGLLIPRAAYRLSVPPGEPWRTTCPAGHPLAGIAGGWLGRARCTDGDSYGPSAPTVAAVTGVVCALLAAATGARPELVVWLLLAPAAVLLATVDFAEHRLPDVLTLPLAAAALVLLGGAALLPGAAGSWTSALLGSLVLGAGYFVLFLISRDFGFGDVKLALVLGTVLGWYGWAIVLVGTFVGYLLGALYGIGLMLAGRAGRTTRIPFGPFLLAGMLVGVLLGSYTP